MFGSRRRRAASNPHLNGSNANPAATTAATSAFLKNQASNASLSSAAAAAALRSRPAAPISVADVQTKRTLRRSGSTASTGSSVGGSSRGSTPQLERRGSSGSMSERTFRSPSPGRAAQSVSSALDAPPVPAIPQNIPVIPAKSHRRAASMETPPTRVVSPPPKKASGRGSSLGPGTTAQAPPRRAGQRMSNLSSVSELSCIERPESRGSVNFSYPTSSRPKSPIGQRRLTSPSPSRANPTQITSTNQNTVYDPNTRSFLPVAEILAIEYRIQDAANRPVKKKKRIAPKQATGTHLADGTANGRPRGTAIDEMEAAISQTPRAAQQKLDELPQSMPAPAPVPTPALASMLEPATAIPRKKKKKKKVVMSESESDQASYIPNSSDNDSDVSMSHNTRARALLAKKPSIVREDREREEEEDDTLKGAKAQDESRIDTSPDSNRTISPSPLSRSGRGHGKGQALASAAYAQDRQHARSASQPVQPSTSASSYEAGPVTNESVRGSRVQSISPARTAHFATTPDSLQVKHQPPARSISPRKSALKHSSSRGSSPVPGAISQSETSNGSAALEEQISVPRKKANRVSFEETNVVGQAATPVASQSPILQSPQEKKKWYSISREKKKDMTIMDDEDDEIMKPRPALPSFGSVREKKSPQKVGERQLVKPAEPVEARTASSSPLFSSPLAEVIEHPQGQSNDHAVGAIISQDSTMKNAANISKSREPLPPKVLSAEGSGYCSETDSSVSGLENEETGVTSAEPQTIMESFQSDNESSAHDAVPNHEDEKPTPTQGNATNGEVPIIAISQPTPTLDDHKAWLGLPGGWESSASDSGISGQEESPRVSAEHSIGASPAAIGVVEPPAPKIPQTGSPSVGETAVENSHNTSAIMEETEESDTSVYSDAAEDLSEGEGNGFMSLDAVVESPVASSIAGLAIPSPHDSPTVKLTEDSTHRKSDFLNKGNEPTLNEGWDKAQEYWKGLSADKKRRIELEATREAADGSDVAAEAQPTLNPRKEAKTAKPVPVSVPSQTPVSHDRTYMIQPGTKVSSNGHVPIRSSMRADPPSSLGDSHMRKSMRSQGQGSMRDSKRGAPTVESRVALQKKQRPTSLPIEVKANTTSVKKHSRTVSAAGVNASPATAKRNTEPPIPVLRRKNSGDSDTSFKRTKPTTEMNFRRSMRNNTEQPLSERPQSPQSSSRFSIRSLSPTGSMLRRPFKSGADKEPQNQLRMSMRGNQVPTPTMRDKSSKPSKPPMKMPGFGRSATAAGKQKPIGKRASRFADSSEEEDERPAFRSRFVDSSDDSNNEPVPLSNKMRGSMRAPAAAPAPVRGIPKLSGVEDGDSSDLPDTDDEKTPTSPGMKLSRKRGHNGAAATKGGQGATLASGSLHRSGLGAGMLNSSTMTTSITAKPIRPADTRRGSIMSILRRKKDPSSKVRKSDAESPARRDTPLERSKSDLEALKSDRPQTPKLQKRNALSRENSSQWPLSAPPKVGDSPPGILNDKDGRPYTADGEGSTVTSSVNGARVDTGTRFTSKSPSGADLNGVEGVNGIATKDKKKKKFGALRKIFRLDD